MRPALLRAGAGALLVALLSGCGATVVPPPRIGFTPATMPASKGVMGADARALIRQFGEPRLDIRDPSARKLQFGGESCVLDAYLYAPAENREPVVTFAIARVAVTGAPMSWQDCARALEKR